MERLRRLEVEDEQAIVQNAAREILLQLDRLDLHPPVPEAGLDSIPWLIHFAADLEMGVSGRRAALELLRRAMQSQELELRVAALEAVAWSTPKELVLDTARLIEGEHALVRHHAYEALDRFMAAGVQLSLRDAGLAKNAGERAASEAADS
jgi:hypothetical protein